MMSSSNNRKIHRVPALLLAEEKKKEENDFYPKVVSIGPYHHGKPELAVAEAFKPMAVELFVCGSPEEEQFFYQKLVDMIDQVRNCYEDESVAKYSDVELAQMMLRDASLIIILMEINVYVRPELMEAGDPRELFRKWEAMVEHLGRFTVRHLLQDICLVENQIPFGVMELLIKLRHGEGKVEEMMYTFVNLTCLGQNQPWVPLPQPPLHLLQFMHMVITYRAPDVILRQIRVQYLNIDPMRVSHSFRRATDLKAKGINFRPSATPMLMDVKFKPGLFRATLQLPTWIFTHNSKPFFKNLVAYESLPGCGTPPLVGSYMDLMKSLIMRVEDVKELRDRGILYTLGSSDEEVLNLYKNIKLYGASDLTLFLDVRDDIQAHYNSRIKTWMAELIHTYFRSPWTAIAFLAAATIVALTAAQLYYAAHPP